MMNKENSIVVTSFYHFQNLPNYEDLKMPLLEYCNNLELKGTILLASEGINSTISGERDSINHLYNHLNNDLSINITNYKESYSNFKPFLKMKVRLKKEIVTLRVDDLDINKRGKYIKSEEWPEFIAQDDVITIDTRNDYEIKLGTFKNSVNPNTKSFKDFPMWVKANKDMLKGKKIAMFCTGGVRCEKSTAYMIHEGFDEVYHLEGGVIQYFEDTNNVSGSFEGSCFVFDDRVALNDKLEQSGDIICTKCSNPLTTDDVRDAACADLRICVNCL